MRERQQWILDFIRRFHEDAGYMPSVRDILRASDMRSTFTVDYNLRILERDGHLTRAPGIARGIRLTTQ